MQRPKRDVDYMPDLSRTATAIEAYDAFDQAFCPDGMTNKQVLEEFAKLEALGKAVGHAFGLDTDDRNNLSTCEQCVRPGPAVPGAGCELSFVRRMVARWKQQKDIVKAEERHESK